MKQDNEKLTSTIETLCCDLRPIRPICSPLWRSLLWMLIALSYTVAVALAVGLRENLAVRMLEHRYLFEILLAFATGIAASLVTFRLSIPDSASGRYASLLSVPATLLAVHMLWMVCRLVIEGMGPIPHGWFNGCWMDAVLMAALPAGAAVFLIRKGATTRPGFLAFNAVLAVSSFGWIGVRLTCPYDTVGKAYCVNFLPYLAIGLVAGFLARKLFRW
jgi:hypothetical protein